MPQLAFEFGGTVERPSGGVYEASDIGKVELKEETLTVELVLSDPVPDAGITKSSPIDTRYLDRSYQSETDFTKTLEDTAIYSANQDDDSGTVTAGSYLPNAPFIPKQDAGVAPPFVPPTLEETSCLAPTTSQTDPTGKDNELSLEPPDKEVPPGSTATPPKGRYFYDPECDTCCHSPTDSPAQFYSLCLLISTDPDITKMVEQGMIDEVYSSIPALDNKFRNGDPGAFLQETSFLDFTNQKVEALVKSNLFVNPTTMFRVEPRLGAMNTMAVMKSDVMSYQFQREFNFRIPPKCQHLVLFTFIRFDETAFNEKYGTPNLSLPQGVYTGPIKEVAVILNSNLQTMATAFIDPTTMEQVTAPVQKTANGSYFTLSPTKRITPRRLAKIKIPVGNLRSDQVLARLKKVCSVSIMQALQSQQQDSRPLPQNMFWLSKGAKDVNTLFMMYNQEQLIMQNSYIKNMKSKSIYIDQEMLSLDVEKIDLFDEDKNEIINSTVGTRGTFGSKIRSNTSYKSKKLPDQETISSTGGRVVMATLTELPSLTRGIKFLQVIDRTPTSGKFAYRATFTFLDPTITFLKTVTKDYISRLDALQTAHNTLATKREDIKKGLLDASTLHNQVLDVSKTAIAKAVMILNSLPNIEFNPTYFTYYLASLANPRATPDDHNDLMSVLRTLEQTLISLLRSAGVKIDGVDDIGSTTENKRSATNKQKSIVTVELQSQQFSNGTGVGIDFIAMGDTQASTTTSPAILDSTYFSRRADLEFQKFWNVGDTSLGANEALLRNKATFNLTPTKVYGVDEDINFDKQINYDSTFEQKVKKTKLAKDQKPSKTNAFYTILDSLENLPASFQIVPAEFDLLSSENQIVTNYNLVDKYLENQSNFGSDNIDTVKNKKQQVDRYDGQSDKILVSLEGAFAEGFNKIAQGSTSDDIASNLPLEQVVDSTQLSMLPPSLQAYKLRASSASKLSSFVTTNGLLSDPSNQIYLKNYLGIVGKLQYAKLKPSNLNSIEWVDLDQQAITANKVLFCRVLPMDDKRLRIGLEQTVDIYNQFFVIQTDTRSMKTGTNASNIRPTKSNSIQDVTATEATVASRIQTIMNQRTTYNTGVPVAYTKIIH